MLEAARFKVPPEQSGPLLEAVGAEGTAFTMATVVVRTELQPLAVAVTAYVPLLAVPELAMTGFCAVEVKPFGPVHW